jgi:hypothetical protein
MVKSLDHVLLHLPGSLDSAQRRRRKHPALVRTTIITILGLLFCTIAVGATAYAKQPATSVEPASPRRSLSGVVRTPVSAKQTPVQRLFHTEPRHGQHPQNRDGRVLLDPLLTARQPSNLPTVARPQSCSSEAGRGRLHRHKHDAITQENNDERPGKQDSQTQEQGRPLCVPLTLSGRHNPADHHILKKGSGTTLATGRRLSLDPPLASSTVTLPQRRQDQNRLRLLSRQPKLTHPDTKVKGGHSASPTPPPLSTTTHTDKATPSARPPSSALPSAHCCFWACYCIWGG